MLTVIKLVTTCLILVIFSILTNNVCAVDLKRRKTFYPIEITSNSSKALEIYKENGLGSVDSTDHVCRRFTPVEGVLNGDILCFEAINANSAVELLKNRILVPPHGKHSECESKYVFGGKSKTKFEMIRCKSMVVNKNAVKNTTETTARSDFFLANTPEKDLYYLFEPYGKTHGVSLKGILKLKLDSENYLNLLGDYDNSYVSMDFASTHYPLYSSYIPKKDAENDKPHPIDSIYSVKDMFIHQENSDSDISISDHEQRELISAKENGTEYIASVIHEFQQAGKQKNVTEKVTASKRLKTCDFYSHEHDKYFQYLNFLSDSSESSESSESCALSDITETTIHTESNESIDIPLYDDNTSDKIFEHLEEPPILDTESSVVIWHVSNELQPQAKLLHSREITTVQFCPHDGNLLAAGDTSGHLVVWNVSLSNIKMKCSSISSKCSEEMENWNYIDEDFIHNPVATSPQNMSHQESITHLEWIHPKLKVCDNGLLSKTLNSEKSSQIFTSSLDGRIKIWGIKSCRSSSSSFSQTDRLSLKNCWEIKLIHTVEVTIPKLRQHLLPICRFVLDIPNPRYKKRVTRDESQTLYTPYEIGMEEITDPFSQRAFVSTITGELGVITWSATKRSSTRIYSNTTECDHNWWGFVHDAEISSMSRNYFFPSIILTTGGHIFALWNINYKESPIWSNRYTVGVKFGCFSITHPGIVRIVLENGCIDTWNVAKQIHQPISTINTSGRDFIILSNPMPSLEDIHIHLGIADSKGIFQLLYIENNGGSLTDMQIEETNCIFRKLTASKMEMTRWNLQTWIANDEEQSHEDKSKYCKILRNNEQYTVPKSTKKQMEEKRGYEFNPQDSRYFDKTDDQKLEHIYIKANRTGKNKIRRTMRSGYDDKIKMKTKEEKNEVEKEIYDSKKINTKLESDIKSLFHDEVYMDEVRRKKNEETEKHEIEEMIEDEKIRKMYEDIRFHFQENYSEYKKDQLSLIENYEPRIINTASEMYLKYLDFRK